MIENIFFCSYIKDFVGYMNATAMQADKVFIFRANYFLELGIHAAGDHLCKVNIISLHISNHGSLFIPLNKLSINGEDVQVIEKIAQHY